MFRKRICTFLALSILVLLFSSCGAPEISYDENDLSHQNMRLFDNVEGTWKDPEHNIFAIFQLHTLDIITYNEEGLLAFIKNTNRQNRYVYFKDNQHPDLFSVHTIKYSFDDDPTQVGFQYFSDEGAENIILDVFNKENGDTCYADVESPKLTRYDISGKNGETADVYDLFTMVQKQLTDEMLDGLNQKYGELPDEKIIRYDKANNDGKLFVISGKAELDDYYNWGYSNYEKTHFSIEITPEGSNVMDFWHIYADREAFSTLYSILLSISGEAKTDIVLICKFDTAKLESGSSNLAELVDYYLN